MNKQELRQIIKEEVRKVVKEAEYDEFGRELPTKSEAYTKVLDVLRAMAKTETIGLDQISTVERDLRDARRKGQRAKAPADSTFLANQKKALQTIDPSSPEAYNQLLDVLRGMAAVGELGLPEINSIENELRSARRKGQTSKAKMDPNYLEKQKKALEKAAATRLLNKPNQQRVRADLKASKAEYDKRQQEWEKTTQRLKSFNLSKLQKMIKFITTPNAVEGLPQGETISGLETAGFKRLIQFIAVIQKAFVDGESGYGVKDLLKKFSPGEIALTLKNLKSIKPKDPNVIKSLTAIKDSLEPVDKWLNVLKSIKPRPKAQPKMVPTYDRWTGAYTGDKPEPFDPGDWSSMTSYEYHEPYEQMGVAASQMMAGIEALENTQDFKNFK